MTKISISLPCELLRKADEELVRPEDGGRSGLFRRLLEKELQAVRRDREVARYVRAYTELPQTDEEVGPFADVSAENLARERWE